MGKRFVVLATAFAVTTAMTISVASAAPTPKAKVDPTTHVKMLYDTCVKDSGNKEPLLVAPNTYKASCIQAVRFALKAHAAANKSAQKQAQATTPANHRTTGKAHKKSSIAKLKGKLKKDKVKGGEHVRISQPRKQAKPTSLPYGNALAKAVTDFQKTQKEKNGRDLAVDGKVGPNTWKALLEIPTFSIQPYPLPTPPSIPAPAPTQ